MGVYYKETHDTRRTGHRRLAEVAALLTPRAGCFSCNDRTARTMSYAMTMPPSATRPSTSPCGTLMSHTSVSDLEAVSPATTCSPPSPTNSLPSLQNPSSDSLQKTSSAPQPPFFPPHRMRGSLAARASLRPATLPPESVSTPPTAPTARKAWAGLLVKPKDEEAAPRRVETDVQAPPPLLGVLRQSVEAIDAETRRHAREVHTPDTRQLKYTCAHVTHQA